MFTFDYDASELLDFDFDLASLDFDFGPDFDGDFDAGFDFDDLAADVDIVRDINVV